MNKVKVTFGIIVLNGHPFIKYNLEALYPFAHEIIVVEGACPSAAATARTDGHSLDGTYESLLEFAATMDPEHKVKIVTAADEGSTNGFWTEKNQMSQAYATRATGNFLWQIDSDEFYMPEDMAKLIRLLEEKPGITAASFYCMFFWGGIRYVMDGFSFRTGDSIFHRLFAWSPDYEYVTHRPPTVVNENGVDLRSINHLTVEDTKAMGIRLYHFDMILPKQAANKSSYYSKVDWHSLEGKRILEWKSRVYERLETPFHIYTVYTHMSWLRRYNGSHPPVILRMLDDIQAGKWPGCELRRSDDIEALLGSLKFRILCPLISAFVTFQSVLHRGKLSLRLLLVRTPLWSVIQRLRGRR